MNLENRTANFLKKAFSLHKVFDLVFLDSFLDGQINLYSQSYNVTSNDHDLILYKSILLKNIPTFVT